MTNLERWMSETSGLVVIGVVLLAAVTLYVIIRRLLPLASRAAARSKWSWDDVISDRRLGIRLSLLGPAVVAFAAARVAGVEEGFWGELVRRGSAVVLLALVAATVSALLSAANAVYETKPISKDRPIEAYVEIAQIVIYLFGSVFVVAAVVDRSPWLLAGGLGALTAVLLLVFRDTIESLVASIILAKADMVDIGDWIEAPDFGADGDVIDVTLHSITVQNFDKTISRIPTSQLAHSSIKNYKGIVESGRRLIKRQLCIDMRTIAFLTEADIARFLHFQPLREYMEAKLVELDADRASHPQPPGIEGDPRRLTNLGTFRAYVVRYLRSLETIDADALTFLVRQREPNDGGIPLEIYAFVRTADWAEYEAIQADIFDHILAMVPEFGLRLFQRTGGAGLERETDRDRPATLVLT